ncbi:MAG: type 4a pilus biogenesis protein PilO [Elusimicrobia bacterium]|nr:type 4a pilus biogenesis protein PilO [Elusimicrobiota bacterium]MDE2510479.1 type 4a pilus biogenesis protein PilO [Elusimicrobiota bacterium]
MAIQLSKQQQQYLGVGAVLFLVGAGVYVKFFWLPISDKRADLTQQIEQIETKISKAEAQASRLTRLQSELATLNQQAVEAEKRLPKDKDVPDILVTLARIAEKYKVSIQGFAPGPQKAQQYFTELAYPMSVKGTYHDIGRFLAAIALETRIFNVKDVVYPSADGQGQMTVTFILLTYQYKG